MKNPQRPLAPHVQAAITGVQPKKSATPGRPLAAHVQAAIQAKPTPQGVARPAPKPAPKPISPPAAQAKLASPRPAMPAGRLPPRARAIQLSQASEEEKLKFWVKKGEEYEWHDEELDARKYYDTGEKYRSHIWKYPVYKKVPKLLRNVVTTFNPQTWDPLAAPIPKSVGKQKRAIVDYLFNKFCASQGTGYDVMGTSGPLVFDRRNANSNSCIGLANSFLAVLITHGIEAEVVSIRDGSEPPFIVRVTKFIDPAVQGHIYFKGIKLVDYYKFTNHSAVWIEDLGLYYDTMATCSYADLVIDAELEEVGAGVFRSIPSSGAMGIAKGSAFVLTENVPRVKENGGFRRLTLTLQE